VKKKSIEKLEALYKRIPELDCKGLCHPSCTIVPASKIEIKRAKSRMGGKNPFNPATALKQLQAGANKIPSCGALKDNKCSIYTARPAICRLYGAAEGLECPFGCEPKKPKLSRQEAYSIIREIRDI
jgi:Fe-S-cluster containining protein